VKLLPFHRFEITSPLRREEVLAAISSRLEERKWFAVRMPGAQNDERFEGAVTADSFNITRIMGYRNSFAPVIDGKVHEAGRFSRIVITMQLHIVVLIFMVMFAVIAGAALAISSALPGVMMVALLYFVVLAAFWFEANKLEQTLRKIFQAM
jgi:hypothetical protein